MSVDKDCLFAKRLPEDDVEVDGIGTVRVRGLSRAEANAVKAHQGTDKFEQKILAFGMVDPALNEDEVGRWLRAASYGELEPVLTRIGELSGLMDDSAKKAVKALLADPEAEFRNEAGAGAGPDGGRAAGADEQ